MGVEGRRARRRRMRWMVMVKARTKARRVAITRRLELYEKDDEDGEDMLVEFLIEISILMKVKEKFQFYRLM